MSYILEPTITSVLKEVMASTTESNLTVSYTKSSGIFDSYRFSVYPSNHSVVKPHLKNEVESEVTFTDLNPGTLYTLSASTVSHGVDSDIIQIQVLTGKDRHIGFISKVKVSSLGIQKLSKYVE